MPGRARLKKTDKTCDVDVFEGQDRVFACFVSPDELGHGSGGDEVGRPEAHLRVDGLLPQVGVHKPDTFEVRFSCQRDLKTADNRNFVP